MALRSSLSYETVVNFFKIASHQMVYARLFLCFYVCRVALRSENVGVPKEEKKSELSILVGSILVKCEMEDRKRYLRVILR